MEWTEWYAFYLPGATVGLQEPRLHTATQLRGRIQLSHKKG
jgi:hypothetical protein